MSHKGRSLKVNDSENNDEILWIHYEEERIGKLHSHKAYPQTGDDSEPLRCRYWVNG